MWALATGLEVIDEILGGRVPGRRRVGVETQRRASRPAVVSMAAARGRRDNGPAR